MHTKVLIFKSWDIEAQIITRRKYVNWIDMSTDWDCRQALLDMILSVKVSYVAQNFLIS